MLLRDLDSEPTSGQCHGSGKEKKVCSEMLRDKDSSAGEMFPCKEQEKAKETERKVRMPGKEKGADR